MLIDLLAACGVVISFLGIYALLRSTPSEDLRKRLAYYRKRLEELRRECKEELERLRSYYETLLRDAAVKNAVMIALYEAWKSGELAKCYRDGGEVRILADGTLLCSRERLEESYRIPVRQDRGLAFSSKLTEEEEIEVEEE